MEFKSQICTTREQSERLLKLGLKKETADMVILEHPRKEGRYFYIPKEDANWDGFPAWSLHRLIEMFSKSESEIDDDCYMVNTDRTYDEIISDFEWSINKGYFKKQYLTEDKK